jgi:DNA (cytosine-5)-methyltransferase 1
MNNYRLASLFCGAGGLDLGFERAGFKVLLAIDKDDIAVSTYNSNRQNQESLAISADLSTTRPHELVSLWKKRDPTGCGPTGIIGGPPCQAFSRANVHKLDDDPRAKLAVDFARIVAAFKAEFDISFFLFENVAGLERQLAEPEGIALLKRLRKPGFDVFGFQLDAVRFGVPQYRNRLFLVGFDQERFNLDQFVIPSGDDTRVTVREAIGGLPEPIHFSRDIHPSDFSFHVNHWCMNPRSEKFRNGFLKSGLPIGRSFRRLRWDHPSWTVSYGHREVHVHPSGRRRLSVYEAMLLQGFPTTYSLKGTLSDQIRLVSDSVPPPLSFAIASSIRRFMEYPDAQFPANAQPGRKGHASQLGLWDRQMRAPRSTKA